MRLCLTTNDMYLSWICWHEPLQFYAKMGHLSREETIISKWLSALRGMTCMGRMSLYPFFLLSASVAWVVLYQKTDSYTVIQQKHNLVITSIAE